MALSTAMLVTSVMSADNFLPDPIEIKVTFSIKRTPKNSYP